MEQEILHLSKKIMQEGTLFLREFSYANTHEVFTRTSVMAEDGEDSGWDSSGWRRFDGPDGSPVCVKNLDSLEILAITAAKRGWEVEWNPQYAPYSKGFSKEVKF